MDTQTRPATSATTQDGATTTTRTRATTHRCLNPSPPPSMTGNGTRNPYRYSSATAFSSSDTTSSDLCMELTVAMRGKPSCRPARRQHNKHHTRWSTVQSGACDTAPSPYFRRRCTTVHGAPARPTVPPPATSQWLSPRSSRVSIATCRTRNTALGLDNPRTQRLVRCHTIPPAAYAPLLAVVGMQLVRDGNRACCIGIAARSTMTRRSGHVHHQRRQRRRHRPRDN